MTISTLEVTYKHNTIVSLTTLNTGDMFTVNNNFVVGLKLNNCITVYKRPKLWSFTTIYFMEDWKNR